MGVFNYKPLIKKTNLKKNSNNFINSIHQIPSKESNRLERHKTIMIERQRHEPSIHNEKDFNKKSLAYDFMKTNTTTIIKERIKTSIPSQESISNEVFNEFFSKVNFHHIKISLTILIKTHI